MKPIREILNEKAVQTVYTITPPATVLEAIRIMADKHVGALLVMEGDAIAGIVTERDYARKVILRGRLSKDTLVREIMTPRVMYVRPDQTNEECMALMTDLRLRHLPVVEDGRLIGMISIGDLVKDIISEQRFVIEQLQHYIMGDYG